MSLVNAEKLIKQLLTQSYVFYHQKNINILVISAGRFPSYEIMLTILFDHLPQLETVQFVLVDPAKSKTDIFLNNYAKLNKAFTSVIVNNISLKKFLKINNLYFDIIYFEHSDLRIFPILLAKCMGLFVTTVSLRESIPYLTTLINNRALIIATCLSKHETYQLKYLLKYSLDVKPEAVYLTEKYLYGGPYSSGLFVVMNHLSPTNVLKKKADAIRINDNFLFFSYILSGLIIYLNLYHHFTFKLTILILVICFLQLFFYRPGRYNYSILCFLISILCILGINIISNS